MADLRITDAPEIDESEVQGGLKLPTGGFGNKAINMNTVANWVVKDKDLPSKGYVDDKFNQGNQGLSGHVANKNNPHEVTKEQVGLGNVDNTADADKPVSNATSAALNLKADKSQLQGLATTTQLDGKADKSTTYTKTEVDGVVDDLYQSLEDNFVANGAALPYDPQVTYNDGAIVVDGGTLKKVEGGTLVNAVDAESVSVGDSTLEVFAETATRETRYITSLDDLYYTEDFLQRPFSQENYEKAYQNGIKISKIIADAVSSGKSRVEFEHGRKIPLLFKNLTGTTNFQDLVKNGSIHVDNMKNITIDFNKSTPYIIFDSEIKNPYDKSTLSAWQLSGSLFSFENADSVTFENAVVRGDMYYRTWVAGEEQTEQTYGFRPLRNCRNVRYKNMKFTGFRGDGVSGSPIGAFINRLIDWSKGGLNTTTGAESTEAGEYKSVRVDLNGVTIYHNRLQVFGSAGLYAIPFRNPNFKVFFFDQDNQFITYEWSSQSQDIVLPLGTRYVQFVAVDDERQDDIVQYRYTAGSPVVGTGMSCNFYFDQDCEFYENMRGGASNVANETVFDGCLFRDSGVLSKLGFKAYSNSTQYAVNFEDIYLGRLEIRSARALNTPQGFLGNCREFIVKDCKLQGQKYYALNDYSCVNTVFENNVIENAGLGAFSFIKHKTDTKGTLRVLNNNIRNSHIQIEADAYSNQTVEFNGNIAVNALCILAGNGRNFSASDNKIDLSNYPQTTLSRIDGVLGGNNTFIIDKRNDVRSLTFGFGGLLKNNILFYVNNHRINYPLSENTPRVTSNLQVQSDGKTLTLFFNRNNKGWVNHTDTHLVKNCEFNNVIIAPTYVDADTSYMSLTSVSDCVFKNGAAINYAKRDASATQNELIFTNTIFDVSSTSRVVSLIYSIVGNLDIKFINCTFLSQTSKTIKLVQAGSGATIANVTSKAIGCRFINVTNDDGITVDENGNVIPFVQPIEPETPPTNP